MSAKTRYQLRPKLEVQYHPGVGGGGTDEILRPTLMCVSNGSCFRLVRESFGKRDSQEFEPVEDVHTTAYRNPPLQGLGLEILADTCGTINMPCKNSCTTQCKIPLADVVTFDPKLHSCFSDPSWLLLCYCIYKVLCIHNP